MGSRENSGIGKSVAAAKSEYDKAAKQLSSFTNLNSIIASQTNPQAPTSPQTTQPPPTTQTAEDPIVVAAKSLGISTEGKTKAELAKEIQNQTADAQPSEKETSTSPTEKQKHSDYSS